MAALHGAAQIHTTGIVRELHMIAVHQEIEATTPVFFRALAAQHRDPEAARVLEAAEARPIRSRR